MRGTSPPRSAARGLRGVKVNKRKRTILLSDPKVGFIAREDARFE